jgi:hypothetical protein
MPWLQAFACTLDALRIAARARTRVLVLGRLAWRAMHMLTLLTLLTSLAMHIFRRGVVYPNPLVVQHLPLRDLKHRCVPHEPCVVK